MSEYKQPERRECDGAVGMERSRADGMITINVETDGKRQIIYLSEFNASRLFAILGVSLNIPLVKGLGIKL